MAIDHANVYDARKHKEFNNKLNMFVNELIVKSDNVNNLNLHQKAYSALYEIMKNNLMRGEIESCHSLVRNIKHGSYSKEQKITAVNSLKDKLLYIASESLLKVKPEKRMETKLFANMLKCIIADNDTFGKYIEYSDLSVKLYYEAQHTALKNNPKNKITYETFSKPSGKTKKIF